ERRGAVRHDPRVPRGRRARADRGPSGHRPVPAGGGGCAAHQRGRCGGWRGVRDNGAMSTSDPRAPGQRSRRPSRRDRSARAAQAPGPVSDVHREDGVRLQKVLADAGLGSRRACETLITEGRVEVDGVVVRELGTRIDPDTQAVHVDTMRITTSPDRVYLALNKPAKVVTAMSDPEGRRTIAEY